MKMLVAVAKLVTDIDVTLLARMMVKFEEKKKAALVAAVRYVGDVDNDSVEDLHSYPSSLDQLEWVQTRLQWDHARVDGNGSEVGSSREHEEPSKAKSVERAETSADKGNGLALYDLIPSKATRWVASKV